VVGEGADHSTRGACAPQRIRAKIETMAAKDSPQDFPYKTYLNILHAPLEVIDVQKLVGACADKWYNQTLCQVNDSVVRLGVLEGEYHWHEHNDIDEFFFVLDGHFLIDLEDEVVDLGPRQGFVVPKGVRHRTRAPKRTVILMVERADIVPTGD
jgi:mannose-6-phosphate isomerase-like protein (cupin superfamily)